jgi:hypothetical protein
MAYNTQQPQIETQQVISSVYTGLQGQCNATASTLNSSVPFCEQKGMGLELSVGGNTNTIDINVKEMMYPYKIMCDKILKENK